MTNRRAAILSAITVAAALAAAWVVGRPEPTPPASRVPVVATVTVIGAEATIVGARATETVIGAPMPLSDVAGTVVVSITATAATGSCEIRAGGVRVAYATAPDGGQAVCVWTPRPA